MIENCIPNNVSAPMVWLASELLRHEHATEASWRLATADHLVCMLGEVTKTESKRVERAWLMALLRQASQFMDELISLMTEGYWEYWLYTDDSFIDFEQEPEGEDEEGLRSESGSSTTGVMRRASRCTWKGAADALLKHQRVSIPYLVDALTQLDQDPQVIDNKLDAAVCSMYRLMIDIGVYQQYGVRSNHFVGEQEALQILRLLESREDTKGTSFRIPDLVEALEGAIYQSSRKAGT